MNSATVKTERVITKAEKIKSELEALRDSDGMIHAEQIVAWAMAHSESALHSEFEWDSATAAQNYRVWQARRLIALYVINETGERQVISLTVDRAQGGGYRSIETVMQHDDLRQVALRDALTELSRVRAKYRHLKELAAVWGEIEIATTKHSAVDDAMQPAA